MQPELSVVIAVYNNRKYIEHSLTSILQEDYKNFEVVIVDDGSTDGTSEILDEYKRKDPKIRLVHQNNRGVSQARNRGLHMASGKYIVFYDGDDFIEQGALEFLMEEIRKNETDALIYGYQRYKGNQVVETCPPIFEKKRYGREDIYQEVIPRFIGLSYQSIHYWLDKQPKALYVENPALWRIVLRRKIIIDYGIVFDERLKVGEDTIFITEYLSCCQSCCIVKKCLYNLVLHETSTIARYEKMPLSKAQGKSQLLISRQELTERIWKRSQIDISEYWKGTVLLSAIELAFVLTQNAPERNIHLKYEAYVKYIYEPKVQAIIHSYPLYNKPRLRELPLIFLKKGRYRLLFFTCMCIQKTSFQFRRAE